MAIERSDAPSKTRLVDMEGIQEMMPGADEAVNDPLDSDAVRTLQRRLMGYFLDELDIQAPWREAMARDEDFYDSLQHTDEEEMILDDRGQDKVTLNFIAQAINWVIGTQKRMRSQFRVLPKRKEASKAAERKSQLLKYVEDTSRSSFAFSDAFAELVKAGLTYLEAGVQSDTDGEPVYERFESWRNIIGDSTSRERDGSDSRYMFRTKWTDVDTAAAMFPKRASAIRTDAMVIEDSSLKGDDFGDPAMDSAEDHRNITTGSSRLESMPGDRARIRLIEAWFVRPETTPMISGGDFSGEIYDQGHPGHEAQIAMGAAEVRDRMVFRTYLMVMTPNTPLWFGPSPYRHNRYPFTPVYCYRRARDGAPYGMVRNAVDAQRDVNLRIQRAQWILASNRTIMDEGAVADIDEFREEANRPDAIIVKKPGKHLEMNVDRNLADAHLALMTIAVSFIQSGTGVTDEAMGKTTNATSGVAITARQEQGVLGTGAPFDAFRAARQAHGEKLLSVVEQFITTAKQIRITNARGNPDYVSINDGLPENDITRTKADYVISEESWNATLRQSQVQQLMGVLEQLAPVAPQLVMALLDLVVEAMDVPNREEVVKRIRSMTGAEDPDADPEVKDPEQVAREEAAAEKAEFEKRMAMAQLAKTEGDAARAQAAALQSQASAQKTIASMPAEQLASMREALELALQMIASPPGAVDAADALITQTGAVAPAAPTQGQGDQP